MRRPSTSALVLLAHLLMVLAAFVAPSVAWANIGAGAFSDDVARLILHEPAADSFLCAFAPDEVDLDALAEGVEDFGEAENVEEASGEPLRALRTSGSPLRLGEITRLHERSSLVPWESTRAWGSAEHSLPSARAPPIVG